MPWLFQHMYEPPAPMRTLEHIHRPPLVVLSSPGTKYNRWDVALGYKHICIDNIYLSQLPLCCEDCGDTNGDDTMNLQDVTRLIDHIYLSKLPTVSCP